MPPKKTSVLFFRQAANYAEIARSARSDRMRRAFEKLARRYQKLAAEREAEEKSREDGLDPYQFPAALARGLDLPSNPPAPKALNASDHRTRSPTR
jgi:alcohol dehydrogenase class IV